MAHNGFRRITTLRAALEWHGNKEAAMFVTIEMLEYYY
jgi:hypothetical protein